MEPGHSVRNRVRHSARCVCRAYFHFAHKYRERRRVKNSALRYDVNTLRGKFTRNNWSYTRWNNLQIPPPPPRRPFPSSSSLSFSSPLPFDKAISQEPIAKASLNLCGTIIDIPWRARLLSGKVRGERAIERNLCEGLAVFRPSRSRCSRTSNRTKVIPNNSTSCLRVARTGSHIE